MRTTKLVDPRKECQLAMWTEMRESGGKCITVFTLTIHYDGKKFRDYASESDVYMQVDNTKGSVSDHKSMKFKQVIKQAADIRFEDILPSVKAALQSMSPSITYKTTLHAFMAPLHEDIKVYQKHSFKKIEAISSRDVLRYITHGFGRNLCNSKKGNQYFKAGIPPCFIIEYYNNSLTEKIDLG